MNRRHTGISLLVAGAFILAATGCSFSTGASGQGLPDTATCADYLKAPDAVREDLVRRLAVELGHADVLTPGYRSNVESNCAERLTATVSDVIRMSSPGTEASPDAHQSEASSQPAGDPNFDTSPDAYLLLDQIDHVFTTGSSIAGLTVSSQRVQPNRTKIGGPPSDCNTAMDTEFPKAQRSVFAEAQRASMMAFYYFDKSDAAEAASAVGEACTANLHRGGSAGSGLDWHSGTYQVGGDGIELRVVVVRIGNTLALVLSTDPLDVAQAVEDIAANVQDAAKQ